MGIFDSIEKLITEHGSAAILSQQLSFAKDQFTDLERKVSDLQTQVGRLEGQLERETADHKQAREELQRLKDEHAEEIRVHRGIEFRRGKRTGGKWLAFCPQCHMPAHRTNVKTLTYNSESAVVCTASCGWQVLEKMPVEDIVMELSV